VNLFPERPVQLAVFVFMSGDAVPARLHALSPRVGFGDLAELLDARLRLDQLRSGRHLGIQRAGSVAFCQGHSTG